MKKLLFILLILQAVVIHAQDKTQGVAAYKIKMEVNEKELEKKLEEKFDFSTALKQMMLSMVRSNKEDELEMQAAFSKNRVIYSLADKDVGIGDIFNMKKMDAVGFGTVYADLAKKTLYALHEDTDPKYLVKLNFSPVKWNITQTVQKINGFLCQKAIGKKIDGNQTKTVVAWFTKQIPVNIAPQDYYGLPGAVVRLKSGATVYSLSKIEYKPVNMVFDLDFGKAISPEEYSQKTSSIE